MTRDSHHDRHDPYGDRDRIINQAPAPEPVEGMWFTLDDGVPGGVRPVSEAEYRAFRDQAAAPAPSQDRPDLGEADRRIAWARDDLAADDLERCPDGDCYTGDYRRRLDGAALDELGDVGESADGWGDHR